jgi:hypothetical protein
MAMTALFLYVTLALLAAWVERVAIAAPKLLNMPGPK